MLVKLQIIVSSLLLLASLLPFGNTTLFYGKLYLKIASPAKKDITSYYQPAVFATRKSTFLKKYGDVFKIHIPGIAKNATKDTVSFESVRLPGYFLQKGKSEAVSRFRIAKPTKEDAEFAPASTFIIQRHMGIEGSGMLRLFSDPQYFLCVRRFINDSALHIMKKNETSDFKKRCSFFIQKMRPEDVGNAVRKSTEPAKKETSNRIHPAKTKSTNIIDKFLKDYNKMVQREAEKLALHRLGNKRSKNQTYIAKNISRAIEKKLSIKNFDYKPVSTYTFDASPDTMVTVVYPGDTKNSPSNHSTRNTPHKLQPIQVKKELFEKQEKHPFSKNKKNLFLPLHGHVKKIAESKKQLLTTKNVSHTQHLLNKVIPPEHMILHDTKENEERHQEPILNIDGNPQLASITLTKFHQTENNSHSESLSKNHSIKHFLPKPFNKKEINIKKNSFKITPAIRLSLHLPEKLYVKHQLNNGIAIFNHTLVPHNYSSIQNNSFKENNMTHLSNISKTKISMKKNEPFTSNSSFKLGNETNKESKNISLKDIEDSFVNEMYDDNKTLSTIIQVTNDLDNVTSDNETIPSSRSNQRENVFMERKLDAGKNNTIVNETNALLLSLQKIKKDGSKSPDTNTATIKYEINTEESDIKEIQNILSGEKRSYKGNTNHLRKKKISEQSNAKVRKEKNERSKQKSSAKKRLIKSGSLKKKAALYMKASKRYNTDTKENSEKFLKNETLKDKKNNTLYQTDAGFRNSSSSKNESVTTTEAFKINSKINQQNYTSKVALNLTEYEKDKEIEKIKGPTATFIKNQMLSNISINNNTKETRNKDEDEKDDLNEENEETYSGFLPNKHDEEDQYFNVDHVSSELADDINSSKGNATIKDTEDLGGTKIIDSEDSLDFLKDKNKLDEEAEVSKAKEKVLSFTSNEHRKVETSDILKHIHDDFDEDDENRATNKNDKSISNNFSKTSDNSDAALMMNNGFKEFVKLTERKSKPEPKESSSTRDTNRISNAVKNTASNNNYTKSKHLSDGLEKPDGNGEVHGNQYKFKPIAKPKIHIDLAKNFKSSSVKNNSSKSDNVISLINGGRIYTDDGSDTLEDTKISALEDVANDIKDLTSAFPTTSNSGTITSAMRMPSFIDSSALKINLQEDQDTPNIAHDFSSIDQNQGNSYIGRPETTVNPNESNRNSNKVAAGSNKENVNSEFISDDSIPRSEKEPVSNTINLNEAVDSKDVTSDFTQSLTSPDMLPSILNDEKNLSESDDTNEDVNDSAITEKNKENNSDDEKLKEENENEEEDNGNNEELFEENDEDNNKSNFAKISHLFKETRNKILKGSRRRMKTSNASRKSKVTKQKHHIEKSRESRNKTTFGYKRLLPGGNSSTVTLTGNNNKSLDVTEPEKQLDAFDTQISNANKKKETNRVNEDEDFEPQDFSDESTVESKLFEEDQKLSFATNEAMLNKTLHKHHVINVRNEDEKQQIVNKLVNFSSDRCVSLEFHNHLGNKYRLFSSINKEGYHPIGKTFTLKTVFKDPAVMSRDVQFYAIDDKNLDNEIELDGKEQVVAHPNLCSQKPKVIQVTRRRFIHRRHRQRTRFFHQSIQSERNIIKRHMIERPEDIIIQRVGNSIKSITHIRTIRKRIPHHSIETHEHIVPSDTSRTYIGRLNEEHIQPNTFKLSKRYSTNTLNNSISGGKTKKLNGSHLQNVSKNHAKNVGKNHPQNVNTNYANAIQGRKNCIAAYAGTTNNTSPCCHFPFKYNGATYNNCIKSRRHQRWCATTKDYDKHKKWGLCMPPMQLPDDDDSSSKSKCPAKCSHKCYGYCPKKCCSLRNKQNRKRNQKHHILPHQKKSRT